MEELRETALAYYANLSENEKKEAVDLFNRVDVDGDGNVSSSELKAHLHDDDLFKELVKDGNGTLDFEEFITFYYMIFSGRRVLYCDGCDGFLKGVYFTCFQCFNPTEHSSFDLCCACFRERKFKHHADAIFYDNFTLLRSKRLAESLQNQMTPVSAKSTSNQEQIPSPLATASQVAHIGNNTLGIGKKLYDIVKEVGQHSGNDNDECSIM